MEINNFAWWAEQGLLGAVLFCALVALAWLSKYVVSTNKQMYEDSKESYKELQDAHRSERQEWRASRKEDTDNIMQALREITEELRRK